MALPLPGPMPTPGNNVLVTLMVQKVGAASSAGAAGAGLCNAPPLRIPLQFLEESRTLMEAATENQNLGRMTDCVWYGVHGSAACIR